MRVKIGNKSVCTITNKAWKAVRCDYCHNDFVYSMTWETGGESVSLFGANNQGAAEKSQAQARAGLKVREDTEFRVVHCLYCGRYQPPMVKNLHEQYMKDKSSGYLGCMALISAIILCILGIHGVIKGFEDIMDRPMVLATWTLVTIAYFVVSKLKTTAKSRAFKDPNADEKICRARIHESQQPPRRFANISWNTNGPDMVLTRAEFEGHASEYHKPNSIYELSAWGDVQ